MQSHEMRDERWRGEDARACSSCSIMRRTIACGDRPRLLAMLSDEEKIDSEARFWERSYLQWLCRARRSLQKVRSA
jgi:hypothetical protein